MQQAETTVMTGLGRRDFLKLGFAGSFVLGAAGISASLSGCSGAVQTAQGRRFLREADVQLLRALFPALLAGSLPAEAATRAAHLDETLLRFDAMCARLLAPRQKALRQLFDLLNGGLTRRLAAGVGKPWSEVSVEEAEAFLARWSGSSVSLFNAGYRALSKLAAVAYFGMPDTWGFSGYPGPLAHVYRAINA